MGKVSWADSAKSWITLLDSLSFSAELVHKCGQKEAVNSLCSGVGAHKSEECQRLLQQQSPACHFYLPWSPTLALIHAWQPAQAFASRNCYCGVHVQVPMVLPSLTNPCGPPTFPSTWERLLGTYKELFSHFNSQAHDENTSMSGSLYKQAGTGGGGR